MRKLTFVVVCVGENVKAFRDFSFVEIPTGHILLFDVMESAGPVDYGSSDEPSLSLAHICDLVLGGGLGALNFASEKFAIFEGSFVDDLLLISEFSLPIERLVMVQKAFVCQSVFEVNFALV